jgi:hypothetical protein
MTNRMKPSLAFLLLLGALLILPTGAFADHRHPGINERQDQQKNRITQGIKSEELTRHETRHLVQGQKRINSLEQRFRADGELTPSERVRVQHAQNQQSRKIHALKNNDRDRE